MADPTEKKPGRDISDLKARLGLQRPLTPPPQAASPAAPAAAPADPRRDPFASQPAQQVMVHHPEITDAGPAMHIPDVKKRSLADWIKPAAMILLPSGFFFFYGGVYNARILHNKTIEDAAQIRGEVQQMRKRSQLIYDALIKSQKAVNGLNPDEQLVKDLKDLEPLTPPKTDKIFKTNYAYLEGVTIDRLFTYYNDTVLLFASASRFHFAADRMMPDLQKAMVKAEAAAMFNYGVVIDTNGPIAIGNLVIVGEAVCKDKQPECAPADWEGMKVKASPTSSWTDRKLAGEDAQRVIPIAPDKPLAQQALIGSAEVTALFNYRAQLADIHAIAKRLVESEKDLLKELDDAAKKTKVFTF